MEKPSYELRAEVETIVAAWLGTQGWPDKPFKTARFPSELDAEFCMYEEIVGYWRSVTGRAEPCDVSVEFRGDELLISYPGDSTPPSVFLLSGARPRG
jgi:hypothetical protein